MKKKPYTTAELFNEVVKLLKQKGLYESELDYCHADTSGRQFLNEEWSTIGVVRFGSNEGIYLDIYAEGYKENAYSNEPPATINIGTFKTLSRSREAFHMMSRLSANFVLEAEDFIMSHINDFTWNGYNIKLVKSDNKAYNWVTAASYKRATEVIASKLKNKGDYKSILIVNNFTKEEEEYVG